MIDQTKKSPQYGNIRAIKEVRVVNPATVHIITDKPFPLLLERLVFFPIVPQKHIEGVGDQGLLDQRARNKDLTPSPTWWTLCPSWKTRRPT